MERASENEESLTRDLDFAFNGNLAAWVNNVMAGNLSVKKELALKIGGFDENFTPPVAYRFETEFARRILHNGGKIWFEPKASIKHLRAVSGGTRSKGSHLTSVSPIHGVGDYYYALRCGRGWDRIAYIMTRPFREIRTKFHLKHPWWIPVKFVGEIRAMVKAIKLHRQGPRLLKP
jgi:GT2 family glycosyltransferase